MAHTVCERRIWTAPFSRYMTERMRAACETQCHYGAARTHRGTSSSPAASHRQQGPFRDPVSVHGAESLDSFNAVSQLANHTASHAN